MAATNVKFTQTTSSKLGSIPVQAGSIYFVTDTQKIYMDNTNGVRSEYSSAACSYGTCSTAADQVAKVITVSGGNFILEAGAIICIRFTNTNTAQNPTFNVNGTGAKPVWYNTALLTTANLAMAGTASRPMLFIYDGTQYVFIGWSVDTNTTYTSMTQTEATAGTATTARSISAKVLNDTITAKVPVASTTAPKMDGAASVGSETKWAKGDHVHPTDTTRAPIASPAFTGTPTVPTATPGTSSSQIATTEFVQVAAANATSASSTKLATARAIDGVTFDGSAAITHYGTSSTAASTVAKVATCTGFTLVTGSRVAVKFTYGNTAASPTLNVNSTGAKAIVNWTGMPVIAGTGWTPNSIVEFIYDGTNYVITNCGVIPDSLQVGHTTSGFSVKCLADPTTGRTQVTQSYVGNGTFYPLTPPAADTNYEVKLNGSAVTTGITKTTTSVTFQTALPRTDTVTVKYYTTDLGYSAELGTAISLGFNSWAIGGSSEASGSYSHAEGNSTQATGIESHSEGYMTLASGADSHAQGYSTEASGYSCHAQGCHTLASGSYSHAEGYYTTASGYSSHAEGDCTLASGAHSHAQNYETIAKSESQTALGRYNVEDSLNTYAVIIGNGSDEGHRSNALTVDWDGNVVANNLVTKLNLTYTTTAAVGQTAANPLVIRADGTHGLHGAVFSKANKTLQLYDYGNSQAVFNLYPVLTKTVTGTTNASGNLNLSLDGADYTVLSVIPSNGKWAIPFIYTGANNKLACWAKVLTDGATFSPVVSSNETVTIYYQQK